MEPVAVSPLAQGLLMFILTTVGLSIGHLVRQGNAKTDQLLHKHEAAERVRSEEAKAQAALNATTTEILGRLADDTRENRRRHDDLAKAFDSHILEGKDRRIQELEHQVAELHHPPPPD
jgi:cytidylate kinase